MKLCVRKTSREIPVSLHENQGLTLNRGSFATRGLREVFVIFYFAEITTITAVTKIPA